MSRANVFSTEFERDPSDPDGYRSGVAKVGKAAGGQELAVKLFEVPPGQSLCPYHYEYVEEWLLVLDGGVVVRTPDGEQPAALGSYSNSALKTLARLTRRSYGRWRIAGS